MRLQVAPFLTRALRIDGRSGRTYMLRGALVAGMLLVLAGIYDSSAWFGAPGLRLFGWVARVNFFLILAAGPTYFAGVLTEEKQAGRLELLEVTGLRSIWILLGTFGAQLLAAVLLLLSQMPFTMLAVTLGGVSLRQVAAAYACLLAHLLMVGAAGLLCSAALPRTGEAAFLTTLLLGLFFFAVPWAAPSSIFGVLTRWVELGSAMGRLEEVLATGFGGIVLGAQFWIDVAIALVFLVAGWWAFLLTARRATERGPGRGALPIPPPPRRGRVVGGVWSNCNPLIWKDFQFIMGGRDGVWERCKWLAVLLLLPTVPMVFAGAGIDEIAGTVMVLALVAGFVDASVQASRVLGVEYRWGTMSSLALLPHSVASVAWHKVIGCALGLAPYVVAFVVGAALCAPEFLSGLDEVVGEPSFWYAVVQVLFLWHLTAYLSLHMRRGPLLLAWAIWIVGNTVVPPFFFLSNGWILLLVMCVVVLVLHSRILALIRRIAAAE